MLHRSWFLVAVLSVSLPGCGSSPDASPDYWSTGGSSASGAGGTGGSATGGTGGSATGGTGGSATGGIGGSSSDPYTQARELCFAKTNAFRSQVGAPPLVPAEPGRQTCTDGEAASDAASGTAHGAFGSCGEFAQNECPGWPGPPDSMVESCLTMMFNEGPGGDYTAHGHYINMTNTGYSQVSCGFHELPDGSVWMAQDFW